MNISGKWKELEIVFLSKETETKKDKTWYLLTCEWILAGKYNHATTYNSEMLSNKETSSGGHMSLTV